MHDHFDKMESGPSSFDQVCNQIDCIIIRFFKIDRKKVIFGKTRIFSFELRNNLARDMVNELIDFNEMPVINHQTEKVLVVD